MLIEAGSGPAGAGSDPAETPVVYAIGDVHGMADLLDRILAAIERDADRLGRPADLVFLGDLINRGPDSCAVVERLSCGTGRADRRWIVLRGNHEQAALDALRGDETAFRRWSRKSGAATLRSYGLSGKEVCREQVLDAMGEEHLSFLSGLPCLWMREGLLFVHAGVQPGVALGAQAPETLLTIRGPFLRRFHGLPFTVVHGHTPTKRDPVIRPGRINIDTGAATTGVLTAAVFERRDEVRFIQVGLGTNRARSLGPFPLGGGLLGADTTLQQAVP